MTREERIAVFNNTVQRHMPVDVKNKFYYGNLQGGAYLKKAECATCSPTSIYMVHGGTVNTAYEYADTSRVAMLNFANAVRYGGFVDEGSNAQEENICRCTNLFNVLGEEECQAEYYMPNLKELRNHPKVDLGTSRIIYSRGITIFKDDTTYAEKKPKKADVITCASPNAHLSNKVAFDIYTYRIEQIVLSALKNKAKTLVLGAWGCGAFGQNPYVMARAFAVVLNKYNKLFDRLIFAIKATTKERDDDMYEVFKLVLEVFYKGKVLEK